MASAAAIGIMREQVYARLEAVTTGLLGAHGLTPRPYTNLSKDPDIAVVRTLEAIADDLEALAAAVNAAPEPTTGQAPGQAAEAKLTTKKAKNNG